MHWRQIFSDHDELSDVKELWITSSNSILLKTQIFQIKKYKYIFFINILLTELLRILFNFAEALQLK